MRIATCISLVGLVGCGSEPGSDINVKRANQVCAAQKNRVVTVNHDYYGAAQETYQGPPSLTTHPAAAELLSTTPQYPPDEKFAIAWVSKTNHHVYARRYRYSQSVKDFEGAQFEISPWPSPGWVRTLGFDDNCTDICAPHTTCAWFTWEDEQYTDVNWRAVCPNGTITANRFLDGRQPSGDSAVVCTFWYNNRCYQWERKKLLAWITEERTQVKAMLLTDSGAPLSSALVLATAGAARLFYQTAVAWSSNDSRWLVSWTDAPTTTGGPVGHAFSTTVEFNGGQGTVRTLMACDGCAGASNAIAGSSSGSVILENPYGSCKGIWLASSYYASASDRFRFHNYGCHLRIAGDGTPYPGIGSIGCSVFCPITEAAYSYGGFSTPYQVLSLEFAPLRTIHSRLRVDSYISYTDSTTHDSPFGWPQAFRSNGAIAVALSTDQNWTATGPIDLALTVVDVRPDSFFCPL